VGPGRPGRRGVTMHPALEEEVRRQCERERLIASARAAAMSALFKIVQRRHDPFAHETTMDHEEDQGDDYR
jgi:adenylate kinase